MAGDEPSQATLLSYLKSIQPSRVHLARHTTVQLRPKMLTRGRYRRLDAEWMRLIVFSRYNSLYTFDAPHQSLRQVSLRLKLPFSSVHRFLLQFVRNGHRIIVPHNKGRPSKIHADVGDFLKSRATLRLWAGFSLAKRVESLRL